MGTGERAATNTTLTTSLEVAVPMHIMELVTREPAELVAIARQCADVVAAHGDDILFRSKRKGATAEAFNALARGLAVLAYSPGGVDFAGLHFESTMTTVAARDVLPLRRSMVELQPDPDKL